MGAVINEVIDFGYESYRRNRGTKRLGSLGWQAQYSKWSSGLLAPDWL